MERGGRKGVREEGNINVQEKHGFDASHMPPTRDLASNANLYLDQELNQ